MTSDVEAIAKRLIELEAQVRALSTVSQLSHSSIEDGSVLEYDSGGVLVQQIGLQYDGTHTVATFAGPIPPTPTAPILTPVVGGLIAKWDGLFAGGEVTPMNFSRVAVHVNDAVFDPITSPNLHATFETPIGGTVLLSFSSVLQYVSFVAVGQDGRFSLASAQVTVTPLPLVSTVQIEADLAALSTLPGQMTALQGDLTTLDGVVVLNASTATTQATEAKNAAIVAASTDAQTKADAAVQSANTTMLSAVGNKSKIIFSSLPASGANYSTGDVWFQRTALSIIGQWEFASNGSWLAKKMDNAVIASLDAAKISTGYLLAERIDADTIVARMIKAGEIIAGKLSVDSVVAANIKAGEVIAGKLAALAVTAGTIAANAVTATEIDVGTLRGMEIVGAVVKTADTGSRIEMNSLGMTMFNGVGAQTVQMPTDGGVVYLEGDLVASGLSVSDNMHVRGTSNELSTGSVTTLAVGVTAPAVAPAVVVGWPSVPKPTNAILATTGGGTHDGTDFIIMDSTGYVVDYDSTGARGSGGGGERPKQMAMLPNHAVLSMCKLGLYYWCVTNDSYTWYIEQFRASDGYRMGGWPLVTGPYSFPSIATDGTTIFTGWATSANSIAVKKWNIQTMVVSDTYTLTGTGTIPTGDWSSFQVGTFDYDATRVVFTPLHVSNSKAYVFTLSGSGAVGVLTPQPNDYFPLPYGQQCVALFWNPTTRVFWSWGDTQMFELSKINWTVESSIWWVSYSWNHISPANETQQSPRAKFTMLKRAHIWITTAPLPTDLGVDSVVPYFGRGAVDPGNAAMWWDSTKAIVLLARLYDYSSLGFTGVNPKIGNSFPNSTPALLVSSTQNANGTPRWKVTGDGILIHGRNGARLQYTASPANATITAMTPAVALEKTSIGYSRTTVGILIPTDGFYTISFAGAFAGVPWAGRALMEATLSKVPLGVPAPSNMRNTAWSDTFVMGCFHIPLSAGTVIGLNAYQNSGAARAIAGHLSVIGENLPDGW